MAGTPISSQGGRDCLTKLLPIGSVDFLIGQIPSNKVLRWALFMKQNLKFLTLSGKIPSSTIKTEYIPETLTLDGLP